jgi:RHS repeat-associated protein
VAGNATSFVDRTAQPGTVYTYSVTASDAAGHASSSASAPQLTTPTYTPPADTTAPSVPAGLTATPRSGSQIDLTWTASSDNVAVAGYRVYRDGTLAATVVGTAWSDTGLAAGTHHSYYLIAVDGANNPSAQSLPASATTMSPDTAPPSAPTNVTATANSATSVTVTWTASTDNVGVTGYAIMRNGTPLMVVAGTATSFTDLTASPSTSYTYSVTATDAAGNPSPAGTASAKTTPALAPPPDTVAPTAPSGLTATAAPGAINLSWTAGTDETALAGYRVYRDGTLVGTTYSTVYVDLGVSAGSHSYTVVAFDDGGNASPPAGPASTSAQPSMPASVSFTYDAADRLTAITAASGKTTTFTIDVLGRHASTQTGTDPVSTYSYLGTSDTVVAVATSGATTSSAIDSLGDRVATSTSAGGFGYILADLHGNVAAAMGASAATISDAFAYDAWGNIVASVTSTLPTPWRYQGRILESAPGTPELYDFGARSYSPSIGAFTSLDSAAGSAQNPITLNRYLYAGANPATLIDPDGHMAKLEDGYSSGMVRARGGHTDDPTTDTHSDPQCGYAGGGSQFVCNDAQTQTETMTSGMTTSTTTRTSNQVTTTNATHTASGTTTNTITSSASDTSAGPNMIIPAHDKCANHPIWDVGCDANDLNNFKNTALGKVPDALGGLGNAWSQTVGDHVVNPIADALHDSPLHIAFSLTVGGCVGGFLYFGLVFGVEGGGEACAVASTNGQLGIVAYPGVGAGPGQNGFGGNGAVHLLVSNGGDVSDQAGPFTGVSAGASEEWYGGGGSIVTGNNHCASGDNPFSNEKVTNLEIGWEPGFGAHATAAGTYSKTTVVWQSKPSAPCP